MRLVVIGSVAAQYWHPNIWESPNDLDFIATYDDFVSWYNELTNQSMVKRCFPIDDGRKFIVEKNNGGIAEVEIAYEGTTAYNFLELVDGDEVGRLLYPSMDWLFTLKTSHRFLKDSPHFEKTMKDYHTMKKLGCKIANEEWLKRREEETYLKKTPRLNTTKGEFFVKNEGVKYIYDHDSIHVAMSLNVIPAYTLYQKDGAEVMVSKKKWDACSEETKLRGVLEEAYVLALERSQIPYRGNIDPYDSFKLALSKVCTSITGGWFREYAYQNYYNVMYLFDPEYVEIFDDAVNEGIVKLNAEYNGVMA